MGADLINGLGGSVGFGENTLQANDDGSTSFINLSSIFSVPLNFFGNNYNGLYVNNNGTITFEGPLSTFTPFGISGAFEPIIAPFFADVDTRGGSVVPDGEGTSTGSNLVYYDINPLNNTFTATWDDVGYYASRTDATNAFQAQIINTGNGNFDIVFRYEDINWTTGEASGGTNGLGGEVARIGYASGSGTNGVNVFEELPISGNQEDILAVDEVGSSIYRFSVFNEGVFATRAFNNNDPHLVTFDGVGYDFQSVGEFTLFSIPANDVEVQVRTKAWPGSTVASVNDALAFKTSDQNIGIYSANDGGIFIGSTFTAIADGASTTHGGVTVERVGNTYNFTLPTGDLVAVTDKGTWLNVTTALVSTLDPVSGLLGNADSNTNNDFALRDGTVLENVDAATIHGVFADSWRITDATSLFNYGASENTDTFTDLSFPSAFVTLDDLDPADVAAARQAALDAGLVEGTVVFDNAVFDIAITGNPEFANFDGNLPPEPLFDILDNVAPTADSDAFSGVESGIITGNILNNDSDDNGDPLSIIEVNGNPFQAGVQQTLASGALLTIQTNGDFTYNPNGQFDGLDDGQQDSDGFTYKILDGRTGTAEGTVSLTINGEGTDIVTPPPVVPNPLIGTNLADILNGDNTDNTIFALNGDDDIYGFDGNDTILAGADDDYVEGGAGDDRILGGYGNDLLRGRNGVDRIAGKDGNDTVDGGAGNDFLDGGRGDDFIIGSLGDDWLSGGEGNDRLVGAEGKDKMRGGEGNDTFLFGDLSFSTDTARDVILDFVIGEDKIDMRLSSPEITSFDDFEVENLVASGQKVRVNHADSDFSFNLFFEGDNFDISASDFVFDTSVDLLSVDTDVIV